MSKYYFTLKDGKYIDLIHMGLLKDEWKPMQ